MNPRLEFVSVSKRFGSLPALQEVDLSIGGRQILALLGPNGAGKSTLFGCLLGLVRANGGTIRLNGHPIDDSDRLRFGYLAERVALYPQRNVLDNGLFFTGLRGCSPAEFERQLRRVGLHHVAQRPVGQLSKGMLQRLGLAIALTGEPALLVLDEPFNGLDPALLENLQTLLREEHERGATLLVSTHTISAIEPLATHVAILLQGRVIAAGALEELRGVCGEHSLEAIYHKLARQQQQLEPQEVCV